MSENPEVIGMKEEDSPKFPFSWFSFLPKFDLRLPLPTIDAKNPPATVIDQGSKPNDDAQKPDFVRFPKAELAVASVEAEAVDVSGKTSNPVVIWQVYALGGILILNWAWARWKERRPQRRSNDDDENEDEDTRDT